MFDSPMMALVRRELLRQWRNPVPIVALAACLLACGGWIAAVWPVDEIPSTQARDFSDLLVYGALGFLFGGMLLIVPAIGAVSLALEREQDTYDMLMLTQISPVRIVLGKLLNTIGFFVVVVLAAAPIMATAYFMIGFEYRELGGGFLLLLSATFSVGALCILCSTWHRRTTAAVITSYLGSAALIFLPIVPFRFFLWPVFGIGLYIQDLVSPVACLVALASGGIDMAGIIVAVLIQLAAGGIALGIACRMVARPLEAQLPREIERPRILTRRARRNPLLRPSRTGRRAFRGRPGMFPDHLNPVAVKDVRFTFINRHRRRLVIWMFMVGVLTSIFGEIERIHPLEALLPVALICVCVSSAVAAGTMITKERETSNMDMLRLSLLTPRRIVMGKVMAALAPAGYVYLGVALAAFVVSPFCDLWGQGDGHYLIRGALTAGMCTFLSVALGLMASSLAKRTTLGVLFSIFLSAWYYLLMYTLFLSVDYILATTHATRGWWGAFPLREPIGNFTQWLSPVLTFYEYIDDYEAWRRPWNSSMLFNVFVAVALVFVAGRVFAAVSRREARGEW